MKRFYATFTEMRVNEKGIPYAYDIVLGGKYKTKKGLVSSAKRFSKEMDGCVIHIVIRDLLQEFEAERVQITKGTYVVWDDEYNKYLFLFISEDLKEELSIRI